MHQILSGLYKTQIMSPLSRVWSLRRSSLTFDVFEDTKHAPRDPDQRLVPNQRRQARLRLVASA
jgi:hypothetical protein